MQFSLVLVSVGNYQIYLNDCIDQILLFNPEIELFIIINREFQQHLPYKQKHIHYVFVEDLPITMEHKNFRKNNNLNKDFRNGFWSFTTERLFYIYDAMIHYKLKNVFHMENDNLIYFNIAQYLTVFTENYKSIAAPFDNDKRCILSFMYIANTSAMSHLCGFIANNIKCFNNDMEAVAGYRNTYGLTKLDYLPVVYPEYIKQNQLISAVGHQTPCPQNFSKNCDKFNGIFDAAAIGQYIGGVDPANSGGQDTRGFINESAVYQPNKMKLVWARDEEERTILAVQVNDKIVRVNNLHCHCKNLKQFMSS